MKNVKIDIPKMSPRYAYIWQAIKEWYKPNGARTADQGEIRIITNRLAIYHAPDGRVKWFHICFPWKLYEALTRKKNLDMEPDYHFDVRWRTGFSNLDEDKCWCGKELTKKEQVQIKLAAIGVKR